LWGGQISSYLIQTYLKQFLARIFINADSDDPYTVHQMLAPWTVESNYGTASVSIENGEASPAFDDFLGMGKTVGPLLMSRRLSITGLPANLNMASWSTATTRPLLFVQVSITHSIA